MITRYSNRCKYSVEETLRRADDFFGPKGLGLEIVAQSDTGRTYAKGDKRLVLDVEPRDTGSAFTMVSHGVHHAARDFVRATSAFGLMYAGGSRH